MDMNARNSSSKKQKKPRLPKETIPLDMEETVITTTTTTMEKDEEEKIPKNSIRGNQQTKKRKKREELSVSATKCLKKEQIDMIIRFK
jgi:hypothetical protein